MPKNIFQDWQGIPAAFDTPTDGTNFSIAVANRVWDPINLVWVSETQPSGGGGGGSDVQYADGFTSATPTGTVAMGKNPSNEIRALRLDASNNLNVNIAAQASNLVTQGTSPWVTTESPYAFRFDSSASPILYLGEAVPGSLTSAPVWRIQKVDTSSSSAVSFTWAGGTSNFSSIWDNRASLSYS
jgi:hypothetical protein